MTGDTTTYESVLPLSEMIEAINVEQIVDAVRGASAAGVPLYLIGGGTSLHYGVPARESGWGLRISGCDRLVDYPARDLTVTVEAGMRWSDLQELLRAERQELPLDVPHAAQATVGGVVATAWTGPRRLAFGGVRDYVIGIEAVDGTGRRFRGGGRVVKNVAGYDFCKLLTGSLGTLGVVTQVTFRVRPIAEARHWLGVELASWDECRELAGRLRSGPLGAVTMGVIRGPFWESTVLRDAAVEDQLPLRFVLALEGLSDEVTGAIDEARHRSAGLGSWHELPVDRDADSCLSAIVDFPAEKQAPLVVRAKMVASGAVPFARAASELDPSCSLWCDVGTGTVDVHFSEYPAGGLSQLLIKNLQPLAERFGGHTRLLWNESGSEMTRQAVWGELGLPLELMWQVKQAFDPNNILNRGRFVW